MTDIEELNNLHQLLTEERGNLDDNLSNAREVIYSHLGWQYAIQGESVDAGDQELSWLFKNGEQGNGQYVYAQPAVGALMSYEDGSPVHLHGSRVKVTWHERSDQAEVVEAKEQLEQAIEDGGSLGMMNEEDLTNLIEVPRTLARSREVLQEAKDTFETRKSEGETLYGTGGTWTGSGYQAYINALDTYLGRFDTMITDIDNLQQAHVPLVDRVIDLCDAILQVYVDTVDQAVEFISGMISLTSGVPSWQSGASALAGLLGDAATEHHEQVQEKLREIKESFEFQSLVELASNIRMDEWPLPEGVSNSWN